VTSEGEVRSWRKSPRWWTRLHPHADKDGYLRVSSGHERHLVHRLVLSAFVGPCPEGLEAAHRDGDPANNRAENLMWASHAENCAQKIGHGTLLAGENHPRCKYGDATVREVIRLLSELGNSARVAERLTLPYSFVADVRRGRRRAA
jgi:hypothetical protein